MRVLTSSVLVMQAIMLGLAIPVVRVVHDLPAGVAWLIAGLALVALVLPSFVKKPWYVPVGWALQVATIACGVFEPMLFILGAVFAALWWSAIHFGTKAEAAQAARSQTAAAAGSPPA